MNVKFIFQEKMKKDDLFYWQKQNMNKIEKKKNKIKHSNE